VKIISNVVGPVASQRSGCDPKLEGRRQFRQQPPQDIIARFQAIPKVHLLKSSVYISWTSRQYALGIAEVTYTTRFPVSVESYAT
jgi:hypothetical protein